MVISTLVVGVVALLSISVSAFVVPLSAGIPRRARVHTFAMHATPKVVAVTGATGAQGGAVVRALAAFCEPGRTPEFTIRAMVRDVQSSKARALSALNGVELVAADFDDETSLVRAFDGANYAFLNTDYWATRSALRERGQIRALADACKACGVQHVIWSTLDDSRSMLEPGSVPVLQGEYYVPNYDEKGANDEYFRSIGLSTTFLLTSPYYDNLLTVFKPITREDGVLVLSLGMGRSRMALISVLDIGKVVASILRDPTDYVNVLVGVYTEALTGDEIAAAMASVLGKPVVYNVEEYTSDSMPEIANMLALWRNDEAYIGKRSNTIWGQLGVQPQPFIDWLQENASAIVRV